MKIFQVGIRATNAEKMWDFAQANQMHVHYVRSIKQECDNSADDFSKTIYIYDFLMAPETYTAFALSVPVESL